MCQSGGRSAKACNTLKSQGFNVVNVAGGMGAYVGTKRKQYILFWVIVYMSD